MRQFKRSTNRQFEQNIAVSYNIIAGEKKLKLLTTLQVTIVLLRDVQTTIAAVAVAA